MNARIEAAKAIVELLAERWPNCFFVYERRRRALKIGIYLDVLAAADGAITPNELKLALRLYCSNRGYLLACREGAARIDLNGNAVGVVTNEEAKHCAARLAGRTLSAPKSNSANAGPKRLTLDDLKAAAARRRQQEKASAPTTASAEAF
jgi:ProP effector